LGCTESEYRSLYRTAALEYLGRKEWDPEYFLDCLRTDEIPEPTFGETLRLYRLGQGISVNQFASSLDIDPSRISRIEHNRERPSLRLIEKMATVLDVDPRPLYRTLLSAGRSVTRKKGT
jgi:DNA-binding XRE family transcriptional regulator